MSPDLLTAPEFAREMRVGRATVWRWCTSGAVASFTTPTGRLRIPRSELERITRTKGGC